MLVALRPSAHTGEELVPGGGGTLVQMQMVAKSCSLRPTPCFGEESHLTLT